MQVYKGLDIGTAKIEPEKRTVVHYLLDVVMPDEEFTAADYKELATAAINESAEKVNDRFSSVAQACTCRRFSTVCFFRNPKET